MRTIHKFPLPYLGLAEVLLPPDARVLSVGNQYDAVVLWAELDPNALRVMRRFAVLPTGGMVPDGLGAFIGTVLTGGGQLVSHVYKREP